MMDQSPEPAEPGSRLERAIELFLTEPTSSPEHAARLLSSHAELRDLLEPMLEGASATDGETPDDVLGDFRIVRELGRGGMGVVYEAWQRSLDRRVAVKVLSPALVSNPSAVARFRREAAAAGKLRHRNIVEVYGFGSSGNRHFFAMQLIDGAPLSYDPDRRPDEVVAIGLQLADALAHAHAAGLVHRDVKPGNILVQDDGSVALTDFGVASDAALPSLTRDGGFLGTLDYAAPEQIRGQPVDERADLWSLGVVLYELLTGEHPFRAATQEAIMGRILTHEPSLRGRPGIPADLAAIVGRTLAKDRAKRYASAVALLADLRALREGTQVSARLPSMPERVWRWARREPWRALAAFALLFGVPAVTGSLGYVWANEPRIEAARAAEATARREEALAEAWWHYYEGDPAAGIAGLASAQLPADTEVAGVRILLLLRLGDHGAADAELADLDGPGAALLRQYRRGENPSLPAAETDSFANFIMAVILKDRSSPRGARQRAQLRRAAEHVERALLLASQPRLPYLATATGIAYDLEDNALGSRAAAALARHFPTSAVARRGRARLLVATAPDQALALLDAGDDSAIVAADLQIRALALEALGRLDEAVAVHRAAVDREPGNGRNWANLGNALRKQRNFTAAEPALQRAVELRPDDMLAWNQLGLTLRSSERPAAARQAFERALAVQPDYVHAAYNLGNLLQADGDLEGARAAFEKAVAADPGNTRALTNLGSVLVRQGLPGEALLHFHAATLKAPDELLPHFNLAATGLELGLVSVARRAAGRAAALDAKGYNGPWVLARAMLAGPDADPQAALAAARTADQRANGQNVEVRITLAEAMAATGDRGGAEQLLDQILADQNKLSDDGLRLVRAAVDRVRAAK